MRPIWIVSLVVPLALWGCKEQTPESPSAMGPYELRQVHGPLSPQDIRDAFGVLGLQIERFEYHLPEDGKLRLTVRRYVDGELADNPGRSTLSVDAGRQQLTVFTQKHDSSLSFSFGVGGVRASWGQIDTGGYTSSTSGSLMPRKLEPGQEVPLYAYAAARGEMAGLTPRPVEQLAAEYPLLIVVVAELREDEGL